VTKGAADVVKEVGLCDCDEGLATIDHGRWFEMIVRDGSGGFVAGSARTCAGSGVREDVGWRAISHANVGRGAKPRTGLMRTGPRAEWSDGDSCV
jgi:hypothetical protein